MSIVEEQRACPTLVYTLSHITMYDIVQSIAFAKRVLTEMMASAGCSESMAENYQEEIP